MASKLSGFTELNSLEGQPSSQRQDRTADSAEYKFLGSNSKPATASDYVLLDPAPEATPVLGSVKGDEQVEDMAPSKAPLSRGIIVSYGTGHILNDLTAACWFTYLLIFLTDVGLTPKEAAAVMMAGQCADALATLLVGRLIDGFGHFKLWHAAGSLLVAVSFSSVFGGCLVCVLFGLSSNLVRTISYSVFAAVFNCGWAATQVSHMSLVNCITGNSTSRVALNSCRNAFTMIANLGLYGIAYLAFWLLPATTQLDVQLQFRWIAGSAIALGLLLVLVFHIGVREPRLQHTCSLDVPRMAWTAWFRRVLYYQVAAIYMLTRLTTNISQAILPFFLIDDLGMPQSAKASIPALVYVCSFVASLVLQELSWSGRKLKLVFTAGSLLWVLSGVAFFDVRFTQHGVVYALALVIGVGNALMLVTATSMEGVLVANHLSGCAFVYGSLSFLDKLACGVALYAIEGLNVSEPRFCNNLGASDCRRSLVRWVLTLVPGGCALIAAVLALFSNLNESHQVDEISTPSLREALLPSHGQGGKLSPQSPRSRKALSESESRGVGVGLVHTGAVDIPRRRGKRGSATEGWDEETAAGEGNGNGTPCTQGEITCEDEPASIDAGVPLWKLLSDAMVGRWGSIRRTMNG